MARSKGTQLEVEQRSRSLLHGGRAGVFGAALIAAGKAAEATDGTPRVFQLTPEQVLQSGEREVGGLQDVINRVDRLYAQEPFGVAADGLRALSNETLSAFRESAATVVFDDGTTLIVGPNSEVILDEYVYDPSTNEGKMSLNILSGLVKFVSGSMSKDSYAIETPAGLAGIRGTELVFLVELDGEMYVGVFDGATEIAFEGVGVVRAQAGTPTADAIVFRTDATGAVVAESSSMDPRFAEVQVVFADPAAYSNFASAFKTAQLQAEVVDACVTGASCDAAVQELIQEYSELGVEKADAVKGLETLSEAVKASGAPQASIDSALTSINEAAAQVQASYSSAAKVGEATGQASTGAGSFGLEGLSQSVAVGLGLGAGNIFLDKSEDSGGDDGGGGGVGVNDNPPTDIHLSTLDILDGSAAGTNVAALTVTDDFTDNANIVYSVIQNVGDFATFSIDPVAQALKLAEAVDMNDQRFFTITIQAQDEALNTYQEVFNLEVIPL